jgi:hypothetical protein
VMLLQPPLQHHCHCHRCHHRHGHCRVNIAQHSRARLWGGVPERIPRWRQAPGSRYTWHARPTPDANPTCHINCRRRQQWQQ